MSLALSYAFVPTPNPIRASPPSGDPNRVDLLVLVTAPAGKPVTLTGIVIEIPCGGHGGGYLSSGSLPAATYDKALPWDVTATGSDVVIKPTGGGVLDSTIAFTLPQIPVEDTQAGGLVPVKISEHGPNLPGAPQPGPEIVKQPADFVVADFHASPPVLTDVDLPVTLYWTVNEAGKALGYRLSSRDWSPSRVFDAADGTAGVPTPKLDQDTDFTLDVLEDGKGAESVPLTVRVENVRVDNTRRDPWIGSSNRILALRWTSENAGRCSVEVDGVTVDASAPADTYHAPYPLLVTGAAGTHELGVTAYGATPGNEQQAALQSFAVTDFRTVVPGSNAQYLALAPDARRAVVTLYNSSTSSVLDLASGQVASVATGYSPYYAGITDANRAYVVTVGGALFGFDLDAPAPRQVTQLAGAMASLAVARDGSVALVATEAAVTVVDLASGGTRTIDFDSTRLDCTITPDSKLGLVTDMNNSTVTVLGLPGGDPETHAIAAAPRPNTIVASPDGKFALVSGLGDEDESPAPWLARLDIAGRTMEPPSCSVGLAPGAMAIAADGSLAVAINAGPNVETCLVGLASWSVAPVLPTVDDVAIGADGTCVLLVADQVLVL